MELGLVSIDCQSSAASQASLRGKDSAASVGRRRTLPHCAGVYQFLASTMWCAKIDNGFGEFSI